jgi:hypothetical protein
MKNTIKVRRVVRDSIRMYFAPLTGAFKGIRSELQRTDREIERRRAAEEKRDGAVHHA